MTSTAAPFGLKALYHPSGILRQRPGTIATGYATAIFKGSPVKMGTDGNIQAAAAGDRFLGAFVGCEYSNTTTGKRVVSNQWAASVVSPDAVCYYYGDPDIIYAVQANGSLAQSTVGESADFATVTGSTSTGMSTAAMSATTSSSTIAQLVVDGLNPTQDNAWGDSFTVVQVRIGKHQYTASPAAF